MRLDVNDHDSIKSAVAHAETEMGTIDILVNNSGVNTSQQPARREHLAPHPAALDHTPAGRLERGVDVLGAGIGFVHVITTTPVAGSSWARCSRSAASSSAANTASLLVLPIAMWIRRGR